MMNSAAIARPLRVSEIALLGIVALILATTATTAKPDMTLYQLQKNCEQTAAETFRRESGNDEDRDYYRAHYNANLNICFYVEALTSFTPKGINQWVYLSDFKRTVFTAGFIGPPILAFFTATLKT